MTDYSSADEEINWNDVHVEGNELLCTGYERLLDEYLRIKDLMRLSRPGSDKHPLGSQADRIIKLFQIQVGKVHNDLTEIRNFLYKAPPPAEADQAVRQAYQDEKTQAWKIYTRLRTREMRGLANELLAVLGGVYLREQNLENMPGLRKNPLSFTDTAENLAIDISEYANRHWTQVLIVGEENPLHSEAEIIRLRFPACDIWNTTLIAFEYGFLLSHKEVNSQFRKTIDAATDLVDPQNHPHHERLETEYGFLPAVKKLWDDYYERETEERREQYRQEHLQEINQFQARQKNMMHRLFADAFAAYITGPAYVYALLYLGALQEPDPGLTPESLPPLDVRLMAALDTLNWMASRSFTPESLPAEMISGDIPVNGVLPPPTLWETAIQILTNAEPLPHYAEISREYQAWLKIIHDDLGDLFPNGYESTRRNWQQAQKLEPRVRGLSEEKLPPRLTRMAVLNAAWHARHQYPREFETIQYNAMGLLANITQQPEGEEVGLGKTDAADKQRQSQELNADVTLVRNTLQEMAEKYGSFPEKSFDAMLKAEKFNPSSVQFLMDKMLENPAYFEAYNALERLRDRYPAD